MAQSSSNPFTVGVATPQPLAATAAAMAPGSWQVFTCNYANGTLSSLIDSGGGKLIVEYADKAVWDSARKKIYFTGCGHIQTVKTIVFDDATTTWTDLGPPPWWSPGDFFHAYQHNTFAGNTHYVLHFGSTNVFTRDVTQGNASWGQVPTGALNLGSVGAVGSLEWFPTYTPGRLVLVQGGTGNGLWRWNGSTWTNFATPSMGDFHNIGVYSPIKDLMYFGGGALNAGGNSVQLYTMSNTGTIVPRANCPIPFGIVASINTVDPVSGRFLVIGRDHSVNVYDPGTNTWTTDTQPPAGFWSTGLYSEGDAMGIVAAPIYDYGVTMFITIKGPAIYLRKGR